MKRIILGITTAAVLSSSVFANELYLSAGSADFDGSSAIEYGFGYRGEKVFSNNIMIGLSGGMNIISVDNINENIYAAECDLRLGYSYKDFILYGEGTFLGHSGDSWNAIGFGGGGGLEYKAFKHVSFAAEYKTVSMNTNFDTTYTYSVGSGIITYKF